MSISITRWDRALCRTDSVAEDEGERQAKLLMDDFREENPGTDKFASHIRNKGPFLTKCRVPKVTSHFADVSSPDSVNEAVSDVIRDHGKIDHLVTSAGFTENFDAIEYPYDRLKKLWGVNVDGTYLFAIAVARHLMERKAKGSMVLIGSMSGAIVNVPQPQAPYNATKAAVRHLASSLAVEWAHADIRVNVISPGYMLTALYVLSLLLDEYIADKWHLVRRKFWTKTLTSTSNGHLLSHRARWASQKILWVLLPSCCLMRRRILQV